MKGEIRRKLEDRHSNGKREKRWLDRRKQRKTEEDNEASRKEERKVRKRRPETKETIEKQKRKQIEIKAALKLRIKMTEAKKRFEGNKSKNQQNKIVKSVEA